MSLKLAISNLAWANEDNSILQMLASFGIEGIEVVPTKIAPWEQLTESTMIRYRKKAEDHGFKISSFQAFLYGKPELQLLGSQESFKALCKHMEFVNKLAATAGADILVFGAPKNRLLLKNSIEVAKNIAIERLSLLADISFKYGLKLGLEAVPPVYGSEFILSYRDSIELVNTVAHPSLVFHLDSGCTFMNNENITDAINETNLKISHFHISQPNLSDFTEPAAYHTQTVSALQEIRYPNWVCIEMLQTENSKSSLKEAISFVKNAISLSHVTKHS